MRQKILAMFAGMLCIGGVAMANLAASEGALGGITPGSDIEYVTGIYGTPDVDGPAKYAAAWSEYCKAVKYGDSVSFWCTGKTEEGPFLVMSMCISANNGFATPRGIHVGSTRKEVYRAYGRPYLNQDNGKHWWYKVDKRGNMVFHFKGDVVASINLGWDA